MNTMQSIFLIFFAIFWGTVCAAWPKWKPFHWTFVFYSRKVALRALWSFAFLNIAPLAYIVLAYFRLSAVRSDSVITIRHLMMSIVPAFAIFGIYRIWIGIIELVPSLFYYRDRDEISNMGKTDLAGIDPTWAGDIKLCPRWWWANVAFGVVYVTGSIMMLWEEPLNFIRSIWISLIGNRQWITILGLTLGFFGAVVMAVGAIVSRHQATELGVSRLGGITEEENQKLPQVQDRVVQSRRTLVGIGMLAIGFVLQIWGGWPK